MERRAIIVGVDEAGRGPLAGPVVAGAVHLPYDVATHPQGGWTIDGVRIHDSKKLTVTERDTAYAWITAHCPWGVSERSSTDIDALGILESTNDAMQDAVAMVAKSVTPTYLLVDGRDKFWFDYVHSSVIGGDGKEACIAAASIVAKVTRDRIMIEAASKFPAYRFERHKGYASPEHIGAIRKNGLCPLHRQTFLRSMLSSGVSGAGLPARSR